MSISVPSVHEGFLWSQPLKTDCGHVSAEAEERSRESRLRSCIR
ncbi:hypothetical protein [Paenibacillus dendritiformis]|nr:hypothetical protein [Paenibacillus dendritiformis]